MVAIDPNNLAATAHLTFSDEFNSLDMRHDHSGSGTWNTTNTYSPGGYAAEETWFVDADSNNTGMTPWSVNNGVLNLTAYDHDSNGKPVTSGHLDTQGTFSQQYGYFEMRAEMPDKGTVADGGQGDGVGGGAFWLLNQDGSWPPELDILEQANWGGIYTTHTGVGGHSAESSWSNIPDIGSAYHTYGVDWEADKTTWYVDGKQVFQADTPADMHSPMYMLLNLYGNDDGGSGDSTMHVDYVRVYAAGAGPGVPPAETASTPALGDQTSAQTEPAPVKVDPVSVETAPVAVPPDPAPVKIDPPSAGSDTLVLKVAQDAYQGDAKFIVKVDGQQIGEVHTAHASHASGAWDTVSVDGDFSNAQTISVSFINDRWDGTDATDRNLYVGGISLGGETLKGSEADVDAHHGQPLGDAAALWGNGSAVFLASELHNGTLI
ncbi:family 16 glycosylhydrolase [Methylobacterium nigriterrae]|uniref:family 16 glycosylhydrolase n=1 Tax=Methylobacterium nigriterrae TaxID=3127512 RepID=UPI003013AB7A